MTAPVCGAVAASCVCVLPRDHDDAHECEESCGGSWLGSFDGDFKVIRLPGFAR